MSRIHLAGLVGISGEICSGKSTLTQGLLDAVPGTFNDGFAWELKFDVLRMASGLDDATWMALSFPQRVEFMRSKLSGPEKEIYRPLLQGWGTAAQQLYGESYWVHRLMRRIQAGVHLPGTVALIDDVRFPHEVEGLRGYGDRLGIPVVVIRLDLSEFTQALRHREQYGVPIKPEVRMHRSERALDDYPYFDARFDADQPAEVVLRGMLHYLDLIGQLGKLQGVAA